MLDERKLAVLRAIITDYVENSEPVGSKALVERYRLVEFFTCEDTPLQSPQAEGLIILKWDENRWRALLDLKSDALRWLETQGAQQITLTRLTLEELVVALVKEEEE